MASSTPISRRQWLRAASLATVATAASLAALGAPRPARAGGPRLLLVGDSMIATAFGKLLAEGLSERHGFDVHRRGKSSSGLSRPDFFDWLGEADTLVKKVAPDSAVVMLGGNDAQAMFVEKGKWVRYDDDAWVPTYAARLDRLNEILGADGRPVVWLGLPPMRSPAFNRKITKINGLIEAAAARREGVTVLPTADVIGRDGGFADELSVGGKKLKVRADDGIHLTLEGGRMLEAAMSERVAKTLTAAASGS